MASTKTLVVLDNNVSNGAGGTNTSATATLTTGYGALLYLKISNGATGPVLPAQIQVNVSADSGANWYALGGALIAALGNAVVSSWTCPIPIGVMYLQVVTSGNTSQAVTVRSELVQVTKI